jgi:hypothetical protein
MRKGVSTHFQQAQQPTTRTAIQTAPKPACSATGMRGKAFRTMDTVSIVKPCSR